MTRRCSSVATAPATSPPVLADRLDAHQRTAGPLPGCRQSRASSPRTTSGRRYLDRRQELIERHGNAVRAAATSWTAQTAPDWAVPMLSDPDLIRDLALGGQHATSPTPTYAQPGRPRTIGRAAVTSGTWTAVSPRPAGARSHSNRRRPARRSDPPRYYRRPAVADPRRTDRRGRTSRHRPRRATTHRYQPTSADRTARRRARLPPHRRGRRTPGVGPPPKPVPPRPHQPTPLPAAAPHTSAGPTDADHPARPAPVSKGVVGALPCHAN